MVSTLELVEEMKKGTIAAHENVELFADFLAGRFSAGFTIASQGLQANIQRMDTAFTLLGEAIFKFHGIKRDMTLISVKF